MKSISEKLNGTGADTFKQTYSNPDRWGNRLIDAANTFGAGINAKQFTVDPATNRLGVPQGQTGTLGYDNAGNLNNDTYTGAGQRTYDAENRMVAAQFPGGKISAWAYYTYNGDGQRVRRNVSSYEIWQVYGFDGELLAEYPQTGPSVAVAQPQKEYGYRNGQLLVTAEAFANLAWNKPATQTDDHVPLTTANKAVNGDVDGALWDGSASATNSHPNSWWQVDLQNVQTISSISVWGRTDCCPEMTSNFYVFVSDNPFTSYDLNATIAQAGVSNYYVPGYSGTPGSITVNRTGRYVRVQLAGTQYLVLGEVQVWSQAAKINWMVTDHLGTPRMIVDKTGSTAGISRHDYLPFGEEIFAGLGGRTTGQGYTANDGVRQQFTRKERDNETGLDYFDARYYASTQGRFTSTDPINLSQKRITNPQIWNSYSYATNNPLRYIDPTGMERIPLGDSEDQIKKDLQAKKDEKKEVEQDKSLSKEARKKKTDEINKQINTLEKKLEGTRVVNAMLKALDRVGERNGLQLSDFTLTTSPKSDFSGMSAADMKSAMSSQAFTTTGYKQYDGTIYIRTDSSDGFYQQYLNLPGTIGMDYLYYGAAAVAHEQYHLNNPGRPHPEAFQRQKDVLQKFQYYYQNGELYKLHLKEVQNGIDGKP